MDSSFAHLTPGVYHSFCYKMIELTETIYGLPEHKVFTSGPSLKKYFLITGLEHVLFHYFVYAINNDKKIFTRFNYSYIYMQYIFLRIYWWKLS